MPGIFTTGGSIISSLLAFIGFVKGTLQLSPLNQIKTTVKALPCILLGLSGMLVTYGDWSYLNGVAYYNEISLEWSAFKTIPPHLIELDPQNSQSYILLSKSKDKFRYRQIPDVPELNKQVVVFQIRVLIYVIGITIALGIALFRYINLGYSKASEALSGWPTYILGIIGFVTSIIGVLVLPLKLI